MSPSTPSSARDAEKEKADFIEGQIVYYRNCLCVITGIDQDKVRLVAFESLSGEAQDSADSQNRREIQRKVICALLETLKESGIPGRVFCSLCGSSLATYANEHGRIKRRIETDLGNLGEFTVTIIEFADGTLYIARRKRSNVDQYDGRTDSEGCLFPDGSTQDQFDKTLLRMADDKLKYDKYLAGPDSPQNYRRS